VHLDSPVVNAVAATAAIVVVLGAMRLASGVLVPLLIAVCVTIAFQPVAGFVQRRGWRPIVTSMVTLLVFAALLAGAGLLGVTIVGELISSAPEHRAHLVELRARAIDYLDRHDLENLAQSLGGLDLEAWAGDMLASSVSLLFGLLSTLGLILLLTVFIQLEAPGFAPRLRRALGSQPAIDASRAMQALADVQHYLLVKIVSGAVKAALIGLTTFAFGLDYPLLWAGLAFVLNFLPVLGPLAAALPPVSLAALTVGPGAAIATAVVFLLINLAIGGIAEPRVLGRVCGLSPLAVVLSLALWAFVLGPVGAMLAVPLTMMLKLVVEQHPHLSWAARLLEYRPVARELLLP
jgi:AI-2 transport protein TqsA